MVLSEVAIVNVDDTLQGLGACKGINTRDRKLTKRPYLSNDGLTLRNTKYLTLKIYHRR